MFQVIQSFVAKLHFLFKILWDVMTSQKYLTKLDIWELFYQPLVDIVHYVISPDDQSFTIASNVVGLLFFLVLVQNKRKA